MGDNWEWKTEEDKGAAVEQTIDPEKLSIIIPVYNYNYPLFHYTGNCLGSVREHTPGKVEIVLVDNGSTIKPKDLPGWKADKIITNEKNEGVAHAWNQGIRVSTGGYICLLNNDTMVFEGWSEAMKSCLELVDFVMSTPMYGDPYARGPESDKLARAWDGKELKETLSDFKDFACVMAKRSLFDEVGLFDEQFGLGYGEDMDFFRRLEKAHKKYASTKLVNIFHIINATAVGMPEIAGLMTKNGALLEEKWKKINEDSPIMDATPAVEAPKIWGADIPEAGSSTGKADDTPSPLVRTPATGDKVFYVKDNKAHWVTSPEVLAAIGYNMGDVKEWDNKQFYTLEYGDQITLENAASYAKV